MFNLDRFKGQLIVSCQPLADEAFYDQGFVSGMVQAAMLGGAGGVRLNSPAHIQSVRSQVGPDTLIIGLWKQHHPDSEVYITPTVESAWGIYQAGADMVALDATPRQRPGGETLAAVVTALKNKNIALMADIATLDEGLQAAQLGFDCVSTTLSGYTSNSPVQVKPDFELLSALVTQLDIPVIMEGRISTPAQAKHALNLGAWAVVVGSAITRPQWITAQFCRALSIV